MASKNIDAEKARRLTKALGHDIRLKIMRLALNRTEPLSPSEAARDLQAALSGVSYHFRVLAHPDLKALELDHEEPVRGSMEHFYLPNPTMVEMPMVREILVATAS